jgi:signal transduction histidine kinase
MDSYPNSKEPETANTAEWVGYELHDGLLQWIVGARMTLQACLDGASEQDTVPKEKVRSALESLLAAAEEGRALITFLERHSAEQVDVDLGLIIQEATDQLSRHNGPPISVHTDGNLTLPQSAAWHVTRIVQQATRNATIHANAQNILVRATRNAKKLTVSIQDDGVGFDTSLPRKPGHFGLGSMQQRTSALGGELNIRSQPGAGTTVELEVPLQDGSAS